MSTLIDLSLGEPNVGQIIKPGILAKYRDDAPDPKEHRIVLIRAVRFLELDILEITAGGTMFQTCKIAKIEPLSPKEQTICRVMHLMKRLRGLACSWRGEDRGPGVVLDAIHYAKRSPDHPWYVDIQFKNGGISPLLPLSDIEFTDGKVVAFPGSH